MQSYEKVKEIIKNNLFFNSSKNMSCCYCSKDFSGDFI